MSIEKSNPNILPVAAEQTTSGNEGRNPDWSTQSSTPILKLPISCHGDIDIVGGVPDGLHHVTEPRVGPTCKRLGIPYAKALVGWDQVRKKNYPKHSGVIIRACDFPKLEHALKAKEAIRQKCVDRLSVLAALFTLNRRAKRCRDAGQKYFQRQMYGFAKAMKQEKERIYRLKGQVLHHMVESGDLVGGKFHLFDFGNWSEVLEGGGYRFHRPCPSPDVLLDATHRIQSIESKPKEASEPALEVAYEVVEKYLTDKPWVAVYEWSSKPRWPRRRDWDEEEDEWDEDEGDWGDDEEDEQR